MVVLPTELEQFYKGERRSDHLPIIGSTFGGYAVTGSAIVGSACTSAYAWQMLRSGHTAHDGGWCTVHTVAPSSMTACTPMQELMECAW